MLNLKNVYDIGKMLATYPRSAERLKEWYYKVWETNQLALFTEAKGVDINDIRAQLAENREAVIDGIVVFFTYNARDLYEFFDDNGVHIEPYEINGRYCAQVTTDDEDNETMEYPSRFEAERASFDLAFYKLEKLL